MAFSRAPFDDEMPPLVRLILPLNLFRRVLEPRQKLHRRRVDFAGLPPIIERRGVIDDNDSAGIQNPPDEIKVVHHPYGRMIAIYVDEIKRSDTLRQSIEGIVLDCGHEMIRQRRREVQICARTTSKMLTLIIDSHVFGFCASGSDCRASMNAMAVYPKRTPISKMRFG